MKNCSFHRLLRPGHLLLKLCSVLLLWVLRKIFFFIKRKKKHFERSIVTTTVFRGQHVVLKLKTRCFILYNVYWINRAKLNTLRKWLDPLIFICLVWEQEMGESKNNAVCDVDLQSKRSKAKTCHSSFLHKAIRFLV